MNMKTNRRHLAKIVGRKEILRQRTAIQRAPIASTDRAKKREACRDLYELGVEYNPSRAGFPEKPKGRMAEPERRRQPDRRKADTYRAARLNVVGNAARMKAERIANGETRSQADRRRWEART